MRSFLSFFLIPLLLLISGCSQISLLTKRDYEKSQQAFVQGDANEALIELPSRAERGTFINAMESSYLNLIQGRAVIKPLQQQAKLLENRVRYHVSREAKTFFYLQTPEDYYAAEHEVIWLHMLLSWGYSLKGEFENACVEARISSSLLSLPWSPAGHFDDPAMRLFLANLWTMCGDWQEARVDLRAAALMDKKLIWATELAKQEQAPAHLFLVLGGPGPDVLWTPEYSLNPLRSQRKVSFKLRGQKNNLNILDSRGSLIPSNISPDASGWYVRHVARESELHELILDSNYGGNVAVSGAVATAKITASTTIGIAVGVGGTALGAGLIYLGAQSKSDDLAIAGFSVIGASLAEGWRIASEGYEESTSTLNQELDASENYRFVRYLPEYLWMGWSDKAVTYPVTLRTTSSQIQLANPSLVNRNTSIGIAHLADARPPE
ncbi:MAG: hypothetical protein WCI39_07950 [Gallionellaceae bacterium]